MVDTRSCATCGVALAIPARKGGQPKLWCEKCYDDRRRARQRVKAPADLSIRAATADAPDEQMARLFYEYESVPNIVISKRPDGAKLVSLSDMQAPFVDEPLLEAVERFMADWQPDDVMYNGDIEDAYDLSDFDKRPQRAFTIDTEHEWVRTMLDRHAALVPNAKRVLIEGNHEARLTRYIWRQAGAIASHIKALPEILGLKKRGVAHVTYGKHVDYLGFVITHGNFVSSGSGMTARRHLMAYGSSGVCGHTHRLGSVSKTDMNGRTHTWHEQGCLCRVDLEYVRGVADWQQGFILGEVHGGALHPQLIHVIEAHGQKGFVAAGNYYRVARS